MNRRRRIPGILLAVLALCLQPPLVAQAGEFSVSASIDWRNGVLNIDISGSTRGIGQNPASAATTVTRNIFNVKSVYILQALLKVRVDSRRLVADLARENPNILRELERFAENAVPKPSRIGTDLTQVTVPFSLELFPGLTELLVHHTSASPLEQVFQWQGSSSYTGLVIYAADQLPSRGETERGQQVQELARPSLFVDLYDPNLNVIVEPNRMHPEILVRWGSAAYTSDYDEAPFVDRIGTNPLRILARELFGVHSTDYILNEQARNTLLFSEENRAFLREGRILIILPEQRMVEILQ